MALIQEEFVQGNNEEHNEMNINTSGYRVWLAERSCTEYIHKINKGFIKINQDPLKVDYMLKKKIKMLLCDCNFALYLITEEGEIYHWAYFTLFDNNFQVEYFSQITDLRNTRFVLSAIDNNKTFIVKTDDEKVYYFQLYHTSNLLGWMREINLGKKIICLSCGDSFFVVVTEDNKVYTWGFNNYGQLGISTCTNNFILDPREIKFKGNKIVKVACGQTHTLALTETGKLFVWGGNIFGEMGFNHRESILSPIMVEIKSKHMSILDITAMKNMSIVIGEDKLFHMWGACLDQQIHKPIAYEYTNLFDACNALCARPPTSVKNLNAGEQSKILKDLEAAFNDHTTSDLTIKVEERDIYVHKIILQLRSSYFRNLFQSMSSEDCKSVIKFDKFSYAMYNAYLKYLYTGVIDVSLEKKFDLLKLADIYNEKKFEESCFRAIKKEMTVANVIFIYKMAKEHKRKELEEYCFEFYVKNAEEVMETNSFAELDTETKTIFISKANEAEHSFST